MRTLSRAAISTFWVGFLTLTTAMSLQAADATPDVSRLTKRAQYEFDLGNFKKAAKLYKEAVTLRPGDSNLHDYLGRAYERMAETSTLPVFLTSKARASFHRSIELNPENQEAIRDMLDLTLKPTGACYGDLGEAAFLTERLSRLNPQDGFYAKAELEEALHDQRSPEMTVRCAYGSLRAFSKSRHSHEEKSAEPLLAKNDVR
jgi:tetratricopeptide (TPR) repeat protein